MVIRTLNCPRCGEVLSVDQALARKVRCRFCQTVIGEKSSAEKSSGENAGTDKRDFKKPSDTRDSSPETRSDAESPSNADSAFGRIGRFELRGALGQGAFGKVYLAFDPLLDRPVALKVPRTTLDDQRRVSRFLREAKAAARLRHPNIVAVFESGRAGDDYYIVSEFVEGVPLSARIADARPDIREAVRWVQAIAEGLAYAHSEGVIHRDIKPSNIMLGTGGRPQVMDFGMAKRLDEDASMTIEGSLLGTPAYMSPEQARSDNRAVGAPSDQYSLGVVLYELITGSKPFDGLPHVVIGKVASALPPPPRSLNGEIPRDLEAVCMKAMDKEIAGRYSHVQEFAADLERWLNGQPVLARSASTTERTWQLCRRHPALATAILVAVVGLSSAAALGISFAVYESRVAGKLREAIDEAHAQRDRAGGALREAHIQSDRATTALNEAQIERDRTKKALAESEAQRLRAQAALSDAENQRTRAETALNELTASRADADSERALVRRLQAETFLDRGLRQCAQGDVVQGMLWLSESLGLAAEDSSSAELESVIRMNLAAWRKSVARAKRQRPGDPVIDVSLNGVTVTRSNDTRPATTGVEQLSQFPEAQFLLISPDARLVLASDKLGRSVQVVYDGPLPQSLPPPFGKLVRATRAQVALDKSGRRILVQDDLGSASLWDSRTRSVITQPLIDLPNRRIAAFALSPDAKHAACVATRGANQHTLYVWNLQTRATLVERELKPAPSHIVTFSPDSQRLMVDNEFLGSPKFDSVGPVLPFAEPTKSAVFSPDGQRIATWTVRNLWLWDTRGQLVRQFAMTTDIDDVSFHPTQPLMLVRHRNHLQFWELRTGRMAGPPIEPALSSPFLASMLSPDGASIYLANPRELIRLPLPATALPGSANAIKLWAQVLTESELAPDGSVRALAQAPWLERLQQLQMANSK